MFQLNEQKISSAVKEYKVIDKFKNIKIAPDNYDFILEGAQKALSENIGILPLSLYRKYDTEGDRGKFEKPEFKRRRDLLYLAFAEIIDGKKGKYLEKIMDLLWAICEETTWVLPAHNDTKYGSHIPHEFGEEFDWVDIFAAADGACVSVVYYLLKDEFESEIKEYFNARIEFELNRRIIAPFISDFYKYHSWKGLDNWYVNNWNPWIVSNALTVALLTVKDLETRRLVVKKAIEYLNHYFEYTFDDGACIEGASYFGKSNCCVYDIFELLFYLSEGEINLLSDPYLKKLIEYLPNMYADNGYYFTMSDYTKTTSKISAQTIKFLKRANKTLESEKISKFLSKLNCDTKKSGALSELDYTVCFRTLLNQTEDICLDEYESGELPSSYMESVEIMTARDGNFVCFFKAGNNHEPHGHNDVGQFTVYYKGKPLFIDPGVERYNAKSFTSERGWCYSSNYHNTPTLNGHEQESGFQGDFNIRYGSSEVAADFDNYKLSLELKNAYIEDSGIVSATRSMRLNKGKITVEDNFEFEKEGEYIFNLVTLAQPNVNGNSVEFNLDGEKIVCDFTEGYNVQSEKIALTDEKLAKMWESDCIYRTRISTIKREGKFIFTV